MLIYRWLAVLFLAAFPMREAAAASGQIKKVLPHYLDQHGRHTLAPSLYERDAYQAHLRQHPEERSAVRFDVQWKAPGAHSKNLKLRLELRGSASESPKPLILDLPVEAPRFFSKWSSLMLRNSDYEKLGSLIAWRATLWDGETLLAERKSFLW